MGPGDSKLLCGPTTIIEGKERCDDIHVGHSVCSLTESEACADHQNPIRVTFDEKTAYVSVHHQPLHCFTPFLCDANFCSQGVYT